VIHLEGNLVLWQRNCLHTGYRSGIASM
jgi:hypothetical protein